MAKSKQHIKQTKPALYRVIVLKDLRTPDQFVAQVLEENFSMASKEVKQKIQEISEQGMSICGEFSRDVAETKVEMLNNTAKMNQYPVLSIFESCK